MTRFRAFLIGVLLLATLGCGGGTDEWAAKRPAVVPAEGMLTYQGKPVDGATIFLAPATPGADAYGASALTDGSGRFELSAFPPDVGAVPGKYKVGVSKVEAPASSTDPAAHDVPLERKQPKYHLPQQYGDAATSGLTLDIPAEGNADIKLDLK